MTDSASWSREGTFLDQLREFERRRELYEQASGTRFDDDLAIATLLRHAPGEIQAQLRLELRPDTSYMSLRGRVVAYELTKRPWDAVASAFLGQSGGGGGHRAADAGGRDQGPQAMEIDAVKGKGKSRDNKQGSQDGCRLCGSFGHWAKDCPKKGAGGKGADHIKGKGKGKDEGKPLGKGKGQQQHEGKGGKAPRVEGNCSTCGRYGHKADCWRGVFAATTASGIEAASSAGGSTLPPSGSQAGVSAIAATTLEQVEESWRRRRSWS